MQFRVSVFDSLNLNLSAADLATRLHKKIRGGELLPRIFTVE